MSLPALAAGGPLLTMAMSACALTVVVRLELLLPVVLSGVIVRTFAVLWMVVLGGVDGGTLSTSVNVAVVPAVSVGMLHETVTPLAQVNVGPLFCVSETKVVFGGSMSTQVTLAAFDGPLFVTVML